MQSGLYVSLSGQVALDRRLTAIATNVANMNTVGYRATEISFHTVLSKTGEQPVAFASSGDATISRHSGGMDKTDNPLDVAVSGDAFLAVRTPAGTVYTRDGRMAIQADGSLQTLDGYPVLDAGNTPILLSADAGAPTISKDGMISQAGRQIGAIGLFRLDPKAKLTRYDNSGLISDLPATPVLDFDSNGVVQGFVENSNVNPVLEMAKLMTISRTFENSNSATQSSENSMKDALKTLGATSSSA